MSILLTDHYFDILKDVSRWKIIAMKSLYEVGEKQISYQAFCKKVKVLENKGLLKVILGMRRRKVLTLSQSGAQMCPYGISYKESDMEYNHDLITTNFITNVLNFESFKAGQVQSIGLDLEADGVIYGLKGYKNYALAVEIELTQKSKDRVLNKLTRYSSSVYYDYLLYVFNKKSIYESYKKIVRGLESEATKKVILLLNEEISKEKFEYENSKCFFKSKEMTFKDIFCGG